MEKTRVLIFGGTGHTGPFVLQKAIDYGYEVYAYVRTPSKIPEEMREKVNIIQGDVLDADAVSNAVEGKHAVFSTLGTNGSLGPTTLMSEGTNNMVAGMKKHGVRKLVVMCGVASLTGSIVSWIARNLTADHMRIIKSLEGEKDNIDWVFLHAPFVLRKHQVNVGYKVEKGAFTGRSFVTGGEIGDIMMKCAKSEEYNHTHLGVSSGPAYISSFQLKTLAFSATALLAAVVLFKFK